MLGPERFGGVANFSTFLLDPSSSTLFMGAKDAILAITWDVPEEKRKSCKTKGKTEVDCHNYIRLLEFLDDGRIYVCGTYAFDPQCAFLDRSSFTLERREDGESALHRHHGRNFLGTMFDISRATGPEQERIRTESSINWLNEFVSASFIEQQGASDPPGDDDKLYFFFTEVAKEYELFTKVKVPRVARVCKSDVGGMKTLQRRWTTFLKAQLVCEDRPSGQRFNVLTDVFTQRDDPGDPHSTRFYGLFTSQWEREELLSDINKVMDGPFKELKKPARTGSTRNRFQHRGRARAEGFESSLKLPDKVLTFTRDHPLMENSVTAAPLLVRRGVTYTKLAVTLAGEGRGGGAVLHLDRGELHRVAVVGQNTTLLQEPVTNIVLHQGQALVGTPVSLARVGAEGCGLYPSCEVCARARGLGCAWSQEGVCGPDPSQPGPGDLVEQALKKCDSREGRCSPGLRELRVSPGLVLLLPCVQRHTRQRHSHLEVTVSEESLGIYRCTCEEAGPNPREPTSCDRAAYQLVAEGPSAGGAVGGAAGRHLLAVYILCFGSGAAVGAFLLHFLTHRRAAAAAAAGRHPPDQKGRDLLASSATPPSPSSASLLSDGAFEKTNGTAMTSLRSPQGNGGPRSFSSHLISDSSDATSGHHGNGGLKLPVDPGETGEEVDEGLGEGLGDSLRGLEEELAKFPLFKSPAPLAKCEESSI
ncbi:hypothetical protein NHX12_013634 [Muraenolepis orangiensis]|uniref:Sema domain-containing protein n=1 Tax=Muraenolepis orangiensis TaxID=630683 RepID=A0A9Q0DBW0_9TELE|nr:hypothetical protein NHX12_013634 [Muraenolepis orangiensis]